MLSLSISSCSNIPVKDATVCTVSGLLSAGANCVTTLSGQKTQLNFEDFIMMLEPTDKRAGAVVIPFDDFIEIKKTIEIACTIGKCKKKSNKIIKNIEKVFHAY
jgi:hypothetical protein